MDPCAVTVTKIICDECKWDESYLIAWIKVWNKAAANNPIFYDIEWTNKKKQCLCGDCLDKLNKKAKKKSGYNKNYEIIQSDDPC
jgi:hypothetical protein